MAQLWTGFERWLLNQFPEAEKIVTPFANPIWEAKEYQAFLKARGFKKGHPGTFARLLELSPSAALLTPGWCSKLVDKVGIVNMFENNLLSTFIKNPSRGSPILSGLRSLQD
jgi:hypothetical protein